MTAAGFDIKALETLRGAAATDPKGQLRTVARQFETLFAQMLLKSMRKASIDSGLWSGPGMSTYRDMLDQQWSQAIASHGGLGIADMLVRQLGGHAGKPATPAGSGAVTAAAAAGADRAAADPASFAGKLWPVLDKRVAAVGLKPEGVLAQAALETGWGSGVPQKADGTSSNNYFGIKAGADWTGERVAKTTREYTHGVFVNRTEWFRAYPSVAAAVDDYVSLLQTPRYSQALADGDSVAGLAGGLQAAGYATDPAYADKIAAVAGSDTFRQVLGALKNSAGMPINQ